MIDQRRRRSSRRRRSRVSAAVLTVSDRVSRGEASDGSGDVLEELLRADGYEVERRRRAGRGRPDRRRDRRARRRRRGRADDRRHRARAARRDARGDAHRARARGARDRRGDPRRLDREDAARPALARRSRASSAARSSSTSPGSPGGCRDGYAVLRPALTHALEAARRPRTATDHADLTRVSSASAARSSRGSSRSSTRSSRCPFAYVGAFLAVDGVPSAHDLLWITVAMVGARSLAMALNRLIDARHRRRPTRAPRAASCRRGR